MAEPTLIPRTVSWREPLVAGLVAAVWWWAANALNIALTYRSTLPHSVVDLVLPAGVRNFVWVSDQPWPILTPAVSALALGALVALTNRMLAHAAQARHRSPEPAAEWFAVIVCAGVIGLALAIGTRIADGAPTRLWNALDGFPETLQSAVLWGAVWGWLPLAAAHVLNRSGLNRRSVRRGALSSREAHVRPTGAPGRSRVLAAGVALLAAAATILVAASVTTTVHAAPLAAGSTPPPPPATPIPTLAPGAHQVSSQWCTADQVEVDIAGRDAAAGQRVLTLRATNRSSIQCELDGYPDIAFGDNADSALRMHVVHGSSLVTRDAGPVSITLSAGQQAYAQLGWAAGSASSDSVSWLHVAAYPGLERVPLPQKLDLAGGASVALTAWAQAPTG